jgi:hypothetical protein
MPLGTLLDEAVVRNGLWFERVNRVCGGEMVCKKIYIYGIGTLG